MNFREQFSHYLDRLRKIDSAYNAFGSGTHKYAFGPRLSESDILVFETQNSCRLPEPYKTFLTEFGNGGCGPSYGVFPVGMMDSGFKIQPWPDYIKPGAAFRFTEAYNNEEILYVDALLREDFPTEDAYEEAQEIWWDEIGEANLDKYYIEHALDGAIPICHHGCALRSWLVVDEKSPEFGNIWDDLVGEEGGVAPTLKKDGSRVDFADWTLDWCAKTLEQLETNQES